MTMNLMQNYRTGNEQDLVQELVEEAIKQRGFDVHYIVREQLNPDYLLGESSMSNFTEFYLMPMFLESMEHFNGSGDLYDPLGMSYTDAAILQVGARTFKQTLDDPTLQRPREGDLVYIPFSDSLWEVTKVKMDLQYYQIGSNHSYRLICKLFEYSHEKIEDNTNTNFNDLGTSFSVDDDELKKVFGMKEHDPRDETDVLKEEVAKIDTFNPEDPFQF